MFPTKIYHYSLKPIKKLSQDYNIEYKEKRPDIFKPFGFWVSIEDFEGDQTWATWCEGEKFRLEALKYKYLINLKKKGKFLYLKTTDELVEFSLKYRSEDPYWKSEPIVPGILPYIHIIDWKKLEQEYDGMFIAPYQWSCRLMNPSTTWYYPWDCASGCIWNVDSIKSIELEFPKEETPECQVEGNEKDLHTISEARQE